MTTQPEALILADWVKAYARSRGVSLPKFLINKIDSSAKELRRLRAENAALRKDAERYRFIRSGRHSYLTCLRITDAVEVLWDEKMDDFFDAEMKKAVE